MLRSTSKTLLWLYSRRRRLGCCLPPHWERGWLERRHQPSLQQPSASSTINYLDVPAAKCRFFSSSNTAAEEEETAMTTNQNATTPTKRKRRKRRKRKAFADLPDLDPALKRVLARAGFIKMTDIQLKTWKPALAGQNVVGRARTGTGKSMAFLLPSLQRILVSQANNGDSHKNKIQMLIVSPTRELADQIADQVRLFTTTITTPTTPTVSSSSDDEDDDSNDDKNNNMPIAITSQVMFGGVPKRRDIQQLQTQIPTILTATPGRLLDHLDSTLINKKPFREFFDQIQILVLDEMDRLFDMGFRRDIVQLVSLLPPQRQTLLFSATLPAQVKRTLQQVLLGDDKNKNNDVNYQLVDCINDNDQNGNKNAKNSSNAQATTTAATHARIQQSYVVLPPDRIITGICHILMNLMQQPHNKIMVFFSTTSQVQYFSRLFNTVFGVRVLDLHSKKSQTARAIASERFRHSGAQAAAAVVLLTTDVSARGVDYPDVTHVLQIGAARDAETYIHRLGRTGRGTDRQGQGLLVLLTQAEQDAFVGRELQHLDIRRNQHLSSLLSNNDRPVAADIQADMMQVQHDLRNGDNPELKENAEEVYRSLFGYYHSRLTQWGIRSKAPLIDLVNAIATQTGLPELPALSEKQARQAGVMGHPSLKIATRWSAGRGFDVGQSSSAGRAASSRLASKGNDNDNEWR